MKVLLQIFTILCTLVAATGRAEDVLIQGGRSPDDIYEVRVSHDPAQDPSDYQICLHLAGVSKPLHTFAGIGGLLRYSAAVERCKAFWHPSSKFVVVTDQGRDTLR